MLNVFSYGNSCNVGKQNTIANQAKFHTLDLEMKWDVWTMLTRFFFLFVLFPFDADHSLRGASLPGPEVGRRRNKGSCAELPVGVGHAGDGGPRGRALPAGRRLLHSAPASGWNILLIFCVIARSDEGLFVYTTRCPFFPLWDALFCHWLVSF